jgi:hypothetical protein
MHRLLALPVTVVLCAAVLTGCGGGADEKAPPPPKVHKSATDSPTVADSSAASTPKELPTSTPEAARLHTSVLGRNSAKTPAEKAVVRAWMG